MTSKVLKPCMKSINNFFQRMIGSIQKAQNNSKFQITYHSNVQKSINRPQAWKPILRI